jgi:hypothetical protein
MAYCSKTVKDWTRIHLKKLRNICMANIVDDICAQCIVRNSMNKVFDDKRNIIIKVADGVITIINTATGNMGQAKCSKSDDFNIVIGLSIAMARYLGETYIPQFSLTVGEIGVGGKFSLGSGRTYYVVGRNPLHTEYIVIVNANSGGMRQILANTSCQKA